MAALIYKRSTGFQPICTFLYPRSCFTTSSTPARALQISTARLYICSAKDGRAGSTIPNSQYELFHPRRCFTTSTSSPGPVERNMKPPKMPFKAPKSFRVQVKEEIGKRGLPDDIGLFENTLIMPTGKSRPGIFSQTRLRMSLEWFRFKARALDFARSIIYKFSLGRPRPRLGLFRTAGVAKALHAKTFKAFAEGDIATLNSICTSSMRQHFGRQIEARPADVKYVWTVHRYIGLPRVVSHKAAIIAQEGTATGQRQAVVKIRSVQSLRRVSTGQNEVETRKDGSGEQQRKSEYFVIQQRHVEGVGSEEWKVWGTLSEKGWEEILERAGYEDLLQAAKGQKTADVAGK